MAAAPLFSPVRSAASAPVATPKSPAAAAAGVSFGVVPAPYHAWVQSIPASTVAAASEPEPAASQPASNPVLTTIDSFVARRVASEEGGSGRVWVRSAAWHALQLRIGQELIVCTPRVGAGAGAATALAACDRFDACICRAWPMPDDAPQTLTSPTAAGGGSAASASPLAYWDETPSQSVPFAHRIERMIRFDPLIRCDSRARTILLSQLQSADAKTALAATPSAPATSASTTTGAATTTPPASDAGSDGFSRVALYRLSHRAPNAYHITICTQSSGSAAAAASLALSADQWGRILRRQYVTAGCRIDIGAGAGGGWAHVCDTNPPNCVVAIGRNTTITVRTGTASTCELPVEAGAETSKPTPPPAAPAAAKRPHFASSSAIDAVSELLVLPLRYPAAFKRLGIDPPKGILLCGPPGVGKTHAVRTVAAKYNAKVFIIDSASIAGGGANGGDMLLGESEAQLRFVFADANSYVRTSRQPAIIFIDEIDVLCPKRSSSHSQSTRLVAQLLTLMDGIGSTQSAADSRSDAGANDLPPVLVVGATNHPNVLDPALRRAGRFDRELVLAPPNVSERLAILQFYCTSLPLLAAPSRSAAGGHAEGKSAPPPVPDPGSSVNDAVNLREIAERSVGYVGADLEAVVREACRAAMKAFITRSQVLPTGSAVLPQPSPATNSIRRSHFLLALDAVPASSRRSHSVITSLTPATLAKQHNPTPAGSGVDPRVVWSSIGGLERTKRQLTQLISFPLLYPATCARLGLKRSGGVLLYGPPGCSKTSLVRALCASTPHASFFSLDAASVYSSYVGGAEEIVRELFELGRRNRPAVICLDEIDAIVSKRGWGAGSAAGSAGVEARLLSTLLNEMDGVGDAGAATPAPRRDGSGADSGTASDEKKDEANGAAASSVGVMVVGTTNRVDRLDDALLRPGRFDHVIYVPPPDEATRLSILLVHTRSMPLDPDMNEAGELLLSRAEQFINSRPKPPPGAGVQFTLKPEAKSAAGGDGDAKSSPTLATGNNAKPPTALVLLATDLYSSGFSGADCANLCREAAMAALRHRKQIVGWEHFLEARLSVTASLPPHVLAQYDKQF